MTKSVRFLIINILLLIGLSACDKNPTDNQRTANQGTLITNLNTLAKTPKAETSIETPKAEEFQLTARAADGQVAYTALFANVPYAVNLTEGAYTIEAEHGQNLPFVTKNPYFFTQKPVEIIRGESVEVELTASLFGFGVEGVFDADMGDHFSSWQLEAEINDVWDADYVWAVDGQEPRAYFAPARVRVILRGVVKRTGAVFNQVIKEIESEGRELYTLKIHVLPAGHGLSVTVETERRLVTDKGIISPDLLPDLAAPSLGGMTFYETTTVPSDGSAATADLYAMLGFAQIEVSLDWEGYGLEARTYQWTVAEDRAALRAAGIDLGADDLSASRSTKLNAKDLVAKMLADPAVGSAYDIAVKVTDLTEKTATATLPIRFLRPEFTLPTGGIAGYVWSKSMDLPTPIITQGDLAGLLAHSAFKYEWSADETNWQDVPSVVALTGLSFGTKYYVRARFRDQMTQTLAFTTETPAQIPGSNFDAWTATYPMKNNPRNFVLDGNLWASTNSRTCHSDGANAFYVSMSGVRSLPNGVSGTHAALYTIGWGKGNTCNFGGLDGSIIKNISAATLFLGTHDGSTETLGRPFAAKPTAMKFYYKYDPFNGDRCIVRVYVANGETILGQGEFTSTDVQNSFVEKILPLVYDPAYKHLPVTSICIYFRSGYFEGDRKYLREMYDYGGSFYSGRASQGSKFYVDEVSLAFDK